jgi:hypothetical protein
VAQKPKNLERARQDSNLQPSVPKTDALSIELRTLNFATTDQNQAASEDYCHSQLIWQGGVEQRPIRAKKNARIAAAKPQVSGEERMSTKIPVFRNQFWPGLSNVLLCQFGGSRIRLVWPKKELPIRKCRLFQGFSRPAGIKELFLTGAL